MEFLQRRGQAGGGEIPSKKRKRFDGAALDYGCFAAPGRRLLAHAADSQAMPKGDLGEYRR